MLPTFELLSFLLAAVLLTATPGPDNLMVLSMGISRGKRSGMAFGLGCAAGCLAHTALAVVGVSALIAASPQAFMLLKIAGGVYLLWVGLQALRHAGVSTVGAADARRQSLRQDFAKGLFANVINPKVALFFLSFLPQFVDAARGQVEWQLGILGVLFAVQAAVLFCLIGFFSGAVGAWLTKRPQAGVWLDRLAGGVFMALGLRMISQR